MPNSGGIADAYVAVNDYTGYPAFVFDALYFLTVFSPEHIIISIDNVACISGEVFGFVYAYGKEDSHDLFH